MLSNSLNDDFNFNNYKSEKDNLSFIERTFKNIETGSIRSAIFILINTAVGSGFLAIPHAIYNYGVYGGIFMNIFGAFNLFLSATAFSTLLIKHREAKIYSELVKLVLGPTMENVLNYIFLLYVWGTLISYIVICRDLIINCSNYFIGTDWSVSNLKINIIICSLVVIITFPLSLKKDTKSFKCKLISFIVLRLIIFSNI